MNGFGWQYRLCKWCFVVSGIGTALLIPFCFVPDQLARLGGGFTWLLSTPLMQAAILDRSAASPMCITLGFLGLAQFFALREQRERQASLLRHWKRRITDRQELHDPGPDLDETDAVGRYLASAFSRWRSGNAPDAAGLDLMNRGLLRENMALRQQITPLVVLGLLGTLAGVPIGFLLTFSEGHQAHMSDAMQQAVVVVATACLSSLWGVGLGQLMIQPLSDRLDRRTNALFDEAITLDEELRRAAGSPKS